MDIRLNQIRLREMAKLIRHNTVKPLENKKNSGIPPLF